MSAGCIGPVLYTFRIPYHVLTDCCVETANRHLEQLDVLFSSESCLAWRAEKEYARKMQEGLEDLTVMAKQTEGVADNKVDADAGV